MYHLSYILSPMVLSLADYLSDEESTSSQAHTLSRNHVEAHNISQLQQHYIMIKLVGLFHISYHCQAMLAQWPP